MGVTVNGREELLHLLTLDCWPVVPNFTCSPPCLAFILLSCTAHLSSSTHFNEKPFKCFKMLMCDAIL